MAATSEPQVIDQPDASTATTATPLTLSYVLSIEGQRISIDADMAADDDSIKRALASLYPEITTAEITRATQDGVQTITVIKRGGPKGNKRSARRVVRRVYKYGVMQTDAERIVSALDRLSYAPRRFNPMIAMHNELLRQREAGQLDLLTLMLSQHRIERALVEGPKEAQDIEQAVNRLAAAPAVAWSLAPVGF